MSSLIALILLSGGVAFIAALIVGLRSFTIVEMPVSKVDTADPRIEQHIKEKAQRRKQDMAEWDREFQSLEPPPPPPEIIDYEEIIVRSFDGTVILSYKEPTYLKFFY